MSPPTLPFEHINGDPVRPDQRQYLEGFFSGLAARGLTFADVEPLPSVPTPAPREPLILEERIKQERPPLEAYEQILENAVHNQAPDKEDIFRFKWNGLFFLSPIQDAFMARLRIPGGLLKSHQLRELAQAARELTTGYVQITTRANLQMRLIQPKDCPEFLRRVQSAGLHTRGSGADNIRNITANPTAGVDPQELINVLPLCQELAQTILQDRRFYDLPRKFNIAYDGGGLIGTVEDTNDIGARAVRVGDRTVFRIALGGATGHKAFARDLGVLVPPAQLNRVVLALTRVYITHGNRSDRKKARLKHLLESWSLEQYLAETEKLLGYALERAPSADPSNAGAPAPAAPAIAHSHIGVHPQKQDGLFYVGVALPVGQITPKQMLRVAEIADLYGSGEIRLTVWQNFVLPNVPTAYVDTVKKALRRIGFDTQQSMLRGGVIACTGNSYCKFAQADTKGHALALADYLDRRVTLDTPINIHVTGCPNSCAQHYMGDIGLLGTKVRGEDGYHIFVGGGFGRQQAVGRQLFTGVTARSLPETVECILKNFLKQRRPGETFRDFTGRHDLGRLQELLGQTP